MRYLLAILTAFVWTTSAIGQVDSTHVPEAQRKSYVTLRTHPLRFIYGWNVGLDVRLSDKWLIGILYQNYSKDFISPESTPYYVALKNANGYLWDVQLYRETHTVAFHGPRLAFKRVTFSNWEYTDNSGEAYSIWRDQQNWYASYTVGIRKIEPGFNVMTFLSLGAVYYKAFESQALTRSPYTSQHGLFEHVYPHVLVGVALGWSI